MRLFRPSDMLGVLGVLVVVLLLAVAVTVLVGIPLVTQSAPTTPARP
jgi:hypothetical protein